MVYRGEKCGVDKVMRREYTVQLFWVFLLIKQKFEIRIFFLFFLASSKAIIGFVWVTTKHHNRCMFEQGGVGNDMLTNEN